MITALDKNTALVLIDLQKGIMRMAAAGAIDQVLANAAKLVNAFRKAGLPIVIVNVNPGAGPQYYLRKAAKPSQNTAYTSDWLEIVPEITTDPNDIFITKHHWNAFYGTNLHEILQQRNITGIVLAGVSTSIGVDTTARSAAERGYNIAFAQDAMTDLIAGAHENSIRYIFPRMGETGDTVSIIEHLPPGK